LPCHEVVEVVESLRHRGHAGVGGGVAPVGGDEGRAPVAVALSLGGRRLGGGHVVSCVSWSWTRQTRRVVQGSPGLTSSQDGSQPGSWGQLMRWLLAGRCV